MIKNKQNVAEYVFIKECFVDTADKDYISARANYKIRLVENFLWSSLQAVEKYLKAILSYNGVNIKDISHEVYTKAYKRLQKIGDIEFDFPEGMDSFVSYLEEQGVNRYGNLPLYTGGYELLKLDKAVWHLRRYCENLKVSVINKGDEVDLFSYNLKKITLPYYNDNPHKYRLFNGFLEKVLGDKKYIEARNILIWNNFYFGRKKKSVINLPMLRVATNPAHHRHPEIYASLKGRVKIQTIKKVYDGKYFLKP